jgi:hypothetical protein
MLPTTNEAHRFILRGAGARRLRRILSRAISLRPLRNLLASKYIRNSDTRPESVEEAAPCNVDIDFREYAESEV